ncbi:MAG: PEP-utilizing enzyme [Rhodanobacteraceae bacterium]
MFDAVRPVTELPRAAALWGGKAATLEWLATRARASRVPSGVVLTSARWRTHRERSLRSIGDALDGPSLIVRSDRADEDQARDSAAGRYRSILDVPHDDPARIADAINAVFASYGTLDASDRVLIETQIAPVSIAVVASTHGLPDGAPYYALSLSRGMRSDAVTRGDSDVETWYIARDRARAVALPERIRACLDALLELEQLADATPCEAEIVAAESGLPWTVQLRRLAIPTREAHEVFALRRRTEARLSARRECPLLGMMPDWNPAELLGEHPRPLARDLFDRLIARRAWRVGRATLGYSARSRARLLHTYGGRPYVDVAASFCSLLPATLDDALGGRLVDAWIARLEALPALHDKVEFDVAITALTCDFDAQFQERYPDVFSSQDRKALRDALQTVTQRALDAASTERLIARFSVSSSPELDPDPLALRRALRRIELDIGTAFATAARQAFVAETVLRSAVRVGALAAERLVEIRCSIETIATEFQTAWTAAGDARTSLMRRFGRQRAGTFELCAPTLMDLADDLANEGSPPASDIAPVTLTSDESARLEAALTSSGIDLRANALVSQYARAVRARELGKFALADRVSAVLDALARRAQSLGIGREEAGWLRLAALLDANADGTAQRERARAARELHEVESRLRMPLLIGDGALDVVTFLPGRPNYLGRGRAHGRPVKADAYSRPETVPRHAMLAIASADPGFEWMFLHKPAAIVTAYGGPNSHIAIRCAELGVPALLGVGPEAFRRILACSHLMIDFDTCTWSIA